MDKLLALIVRYFLMKHNIAWCGKCDCPRSPDVFDWPLPKCPTKHYM